jgi:anthranilate 1,2-dioxygenase ferredoxin subunit
MTGFVSVLRLADLPATGYVEAVVAGHKVLVARLPDGVFAVENRCSHAASELSGGRLKIGRISCPLHGAQFDFRTGASMGGTLAMRGLRTFEVRVTGDDVALADTPRDGIARTTSTGA